MAHQINDVFDVVHRSAFDEEILLFRTLHEVVRWGFSQRPSRDVAQIVTQDEYTHDVVMWWYDGMHLVFDTN